jgi:beta-galactosidase
LPADTPVRTFSISPRLETASLWRNLPKPIDSKTLLTMEDMDQSYGYVLYRTGLDEDGGGELVVDGLHDYAQVYIDQKLVGTLDRRLGTSRLTLPFLKRAATLDILVENSGRINYTKAIRAERKGLTGIVTVGGTQPKHWEIYSLPMDNLAKLRFVSEPCEGPCFYRSSMTVPALADTYLDTRGMHKGAVWVNNQALGRFWSIGPQYTLFTPGAWLNKGHNDVVFFDSMGTPADAVKSVAKPVFGTTTAQRD